MEVGAFSVSCRFKNYEDNLVWMYTGVYGPVLNEERGNFSNELSDIRCLESDPWCVEGDFNGVRFPGERRNCQSNSTSIRRF